MILVDTSVWIDYLRAGDGHLVQLLQNHQVLIHPYVIGEIAMGSIARRANVLTALRKLPVTRIASNTEVLDLVENNALFGSGIGYLDAHLLASVWLTKGSRIWTHDRRLRAAGIRMKLAAGYP